MSVFSAYSAYYDLLYQDKDYAGEAHYVLKRLRALAHEMPTSILEFGCGTGKHAEYFAEAGLKIHGVDQSSTMINQARKRLHGERATFTQGDVRDIRLQKKFDTVVSLFHVASYQTSTEDLMNFFKTASIHLDSGGLFLFDFWYAPAVFEQRPETRVKRMENESIAVLRIAEPEHFPEKCVVEVNFEILVEEKSSHKIERIFERHPMRYLSIPELVFYLEHANFDSKGLILEEWNTGSPPSPSTWSVTAIARKR